MIKPVELTDERKKLIQSYYKKSIDFDSVFIFAFNAANNDVDSLNERFSLKALKSMSELLVGKCGFVTNNDCGYSLNALSRVIEADVRIDAGIPTVTGDPYVYVYAIAYIIENESTKDIYERIINGELTEITIGASCTEKYEQGNYTVIDDISDVYEMSFVYPFKNKRHYNALIDADSLIDEIRNHEYELVSRLGTRDKEMFIIGIQQIVDKLVYNTKTVGIQDVVDKYFPDYKALDQPMREFMNNPENIQRIANLISDIWRQTHCRIEVIK